MMVNKFDLILLLVTTLLIGAGIGQYLVKEDMKPNRRVYTKVLNIFFIFAGIYISILIYMTFFETEIFNVEEKKYPILAAIGIILSAFIASTSVLRSIENTNTIEKKKETQIKNKAEILFSTIKSMVLLYKNKNTLKLIEIKSVSEILKNSLAKIESDREVVSLCNPKETLLLIVEIQSCIYILDSINNETGNRLNDLDTEKTKDSFTELEIKINNIFNNNNIEFINTIN